MNPFRKGDIAYHPLYGAGKVIRMDGFNAQFVAIDFGKGEGPVNADLLSFKPWPKPDHQRPTENGYHLVQFKDYQRVYLGHYSSKRRDAGQGPWVLVGPRGTPVGDYTYGASDTHVKPLQFLGATIGEAFQPQ